MTGSLKTIAIIILLLCNIIFAYKYYHCLNGKSSQMTHNPPGGDTVRLTKYRDYSGIEHAVTVGEVIRREALRRSNPSRPYIDTIAQALDIKTSQVVAATTISTKMTVDNLNLKQEVAHLKDSIRNYTFKDKWLSATVHVPQDSTNPSLDLTYDADLNIVQYWKRKKVLGLPLGPRESYTDISSNDPRTTIRQLKTFTVKQSTPEYGLRLQMTAAYTPYSNTLNMGPSLRVDVGPVSLRTTEYYNFTQRAWRTTLSADYTILPFKN